MISIHPMLLFNPYSGHTSHSETAISIHPMLLFNRLLIKQLIKNFYFNTSHVIIQPFPQCVDIVYCFNFNTSYVIIQPTKNRHSCILLIYINHDFKPFLQHFTNHSIENQLFVRNHVFTPFDRLFQKITW